LGVTGMGLAFCFSSFTHELRHDLEEGNAEKRDAEYEWPQDTDGNREPWFQDGKAMLLRMIEYGYFFSLGILIDNSLYVFPVCRHGFMKSDFAGFVISVVDRVSVQYPGVILGTILAS